MTSPDIASGVGEEGQLAIVLARLQMLSNDVGDMKTSMAEMAKSVTRLAVMEERQANSREAQERAFREIADLQTRLKLIENVQPANAQTTKWVNQVVSLVLAAVIGAVVASNIRPTREPAAAAQVERSR